MGHSKKLEAPNVDNEQVSEGSEKSFDVRFKEVQKMLEDARKAPSVNWPQYIKAVQGKILLWQQGETEKKIVQVRLLTEDEVGRGFSSHFVYVKDSMPSDLLALNDPTPEGASWVVTPEAKAQFMSHVMEARDAETLYGISSVGRAFFVNERVVESIKNENLKTDVEISINSFLGFLERNSQDLEKISRQIDTINSGIKKAAQDAGVSLGDVLKPIQQ